MYYINNKGNVCTWYIKTFLNTKGLVNMFNLLLTKMSKLRHPPVASINMANSGIAAVATSAVAMVMSSTPEMGRKQSDGQLI